MQHDLQHGSLITFPKEEKPRKQIPEASLIPPTKPIYLVSSLPDGLKMGTPLRLRSAAVECPSWPVPGGDIMSTVERWGPHPHTRCSFGRMPSRSQYSSSIILYQVLLFLLPSDSVQHDLQHGSLIGRRKPRKQKETHALLKSMRRPAMTSRSILPACTMGDGGDATIVITLCPTHRYTW